MKTFYKTLIVLSCVLLINDGFAQAPSWTWAKSCGGTGHDYARQIRLDRFGSIYILGGFGSDTLIIDTLSAPLQQYTGNFFLVKFDSLGNALWVKTIPLSGPNTNAFITMDKFDHIYIGGRFITDTLTIGNYQLINADTIGERDIFLAKYDLSGNLLWARRDGNAGEENLRGISTDDAGNIYCTGSFDSPVFNFGNDALTCTGNEYNIFSAKYDSSGNPLWARQSHLAQSNYSTYNDDCSNDQFGNFYITGEFSDDSISFDTLLLVTQDVSHSYFLVKYDSAGALQWGKAVGKDFVHGIAVKAGISGNVYVTGWFTGDTLTLDTIKLVNYMIPNNNTTDIFIAKYDKDGNILWAHNDGGSSTDRPWDMFIDNNENIYLTGWFFSYYFNFGSTVLTHTGSGNYNYFFVKYDSSGNHIWAKQPQTQVNSSNSNSSIFGNNEGSIYVSGAFVSPGFSLDTIALNSAGGTDIFIAKLTESILVAVNESATNNTQMAFYPNPATTTCTITAPNFINSTLTLYDITGRALLQQVFNERATIDISTLNSGVYIVEVKDKEGRSVKGKVVKE